MEKQIKSRVTHYFTEIETGFTLSELLIALSLSSFLMLPLINYFNLVLKNEAEIQGYANVTTHCAFAFYFFSKNLERLAEQGGRFTTYNDLNLKNKSGSDVLAIVNNGIRTIFFLSDDRDNLTSLYYKQEGQHRILVAKNISDMHVLYAVESKLVPHQFSYVKSANMTDWNLVKGVKIILNVSVNKDLKEIYFYFSSI